jgi:hypothetical protein
MNKPDINKKCIHIEKRQYKNGIFQNCVDATYIIHLIDNGRLNSINNQLSKYPTTNTVYIILNEGYQKCNKILPNQTPAYDLTNTFLYIFNHADKNNYMNILILEDDFEFTPKILNEPKHVNNITNFLIHKKNESMMYYLGCLPWIQIPYNTHTNINILSTGTHAVIYTKPAREIMRNENEKNIIDWDLYYNFQYGIKRYLYNEPLCYQLFPETFNSQNWVSLFNFNPIKNYIKLTNLDIYLEPGYSNTYIMSKIIGFIFLIIFIFIFIMIIAFIIKRKNKSTLSRNKYI